MGLEFVKVEALLAFASAFFCLVLGVGALYKEPRAWVARSFALGMLALALREISVGLGAQISLAPYDLFWKRVGWAATAFLPSSWLIFSLIYARNTDRERLAKWKWAIVVAFILPCFIIVGFKKSFLPYPALAQAAESTLKFGWADYASFLFSLVVTVVVLGNLERTLVASAGAKRWQIKFTMLGLGCVFVVHIFTLSHAFLYLAVTPTIEFINSWAALMACVLMSVSLARNGLSYVKVHVSQRALSTSVTTLLAGAYLLTVGVFAKVVQHINRSDAVSLGALFVFLTLLGLAVLLLSDELRHKMGRIIRQHVYDSHYDYRQVWMAFTERTTSVVEVRELCEAVAKLISEFFGIPSVSIWLLRQEDQDEARLAGSTLWSVGRALPENVNPAALSALVRYLYDQSALIDFEAPPDIEGRALTDAYPEFLRQARCRYALPLIAGRHWLGFISFDNRLAQGDLTVEEMRLLKTVADQTASTLLHLQLSERLLRAQQLESFQTLSSFFVHDLKNMTSKLSLTLKNLPIHYQNPAFREDALRIIANSVDKMNAMCGRLSLLKDRLELEWSVIDVNDLVRETLTDFHPPRRVSIIQDLRPVPKLSADREQLQKVLGNLLLNACEAVEADGEIRVATEQTNGWVVLSVQDNGCGMPQDFMEQSLFQPFRTTKTEGLGIGLFQSKMIVEAHGGQLAAESVAGEGSAFYVKLKI